MKRFAFSLLTILFAFCGYAQTMTIHYKNGQSVKFNVESIDYIDFQEKDNNGGTTISEDEAVDLGLSVLWASHNVGATSSKLFGDKFAWGETETKSKYTKENYIWIDSKTSTYIDLGEDIGGTEFDVAHVKWGGRWRLPSPNEFDELRKKCNWQWITLYAVGGFLVTGSNGNSIFIPVNDSAWFWASKEHTSGQGNNSDAYIFSLSSGSKSTLTDVHRSNSPS